jgi:predicted transcriptional regulator
LEERKKKIVFCFRYLWREENKKEGKMEKLVVKKKWIQKNLVTLLKRQRREFLTKKNCTKQKGIQRPIDKRRSQGK